MRTLIPLALVGLLAACSEQKPPEAPARATVAPAPVRVDPVEQINRVVAALRSDDIGQALMLTMPPDEYRKMRSEYDERVGEPVSEDERRQFEESLGKLLEPDGVDRLMREATPKLGEFKQNLPMMLAFGTAMAQQSIDNAKDLDDGQRAQLKALLANITRWAMQTDFGDPKRLRAALTAIKAGLDATGIRRPEDIRKLSFDQAMAAFAPLSKGFKGAAAAYDIDIDQFLVSIRPELLSMRGERARLKVHYALFDTPMVFETDLVRRGDRWISVEASNALKAEADEG